MQRRTESTQERETRQHNEQIEREMAVRLEEKLRTTKNPPQAPISTRWGSDH